MRPGSYLATQALAFTIVLATCLWLTLQLCSLFSPSSVQLFSFQSKAPAASQLSPVLPLLKALQLQQNHKFYNNPRLQHLLQYLGFTATSFTTTKSADAAAEAEPLLPGPSDPLSSALSNAFNLPAAQLCHWLEDDVTTVNIQQRVLVAGLLTNTEALMPHYVFQLMKYAAAMPPGTVFVSLYESGSTDLTGMLFLCNSCIHVQDMW